jgi:hypothetical protein
MNRFKFKVVVNNAGEIVTLFTWATSEAGAKRNALHQLATDLGLNAGALTMRLKDRVSVYLVGER